MSKRRFIELANAYLERTEGRAFELTNPQLLGGLYSYFTAAADSPYDLRKGLWLDGPIGTGKTTLMRVFRELCLDQRRAYRMETSSEIACAFSTSGDLDVYTANLRGYSHRPLTLCIDELGREPLAASYYGTRFNVLQYVLQQRYTLWQTQGVITHVTTNLSADEVIDRYEDYIFDRCRHMFNIVTVEGRSKR